MTRLTSIPSGASPGAALAAPRALVILLAVAAALASIASIASPARAQPAGTSNEFLVPPQGGAYDIPLHAGAVCILSFPEKLAPKALTSSAGYEVKSWGEDGVAVRALPSTTEPATLALATVSGEIKVNVTLRVAPPATAAYTLVRFKAAAASEAFDELVAAAVARRVAPIEASLTQMKRELDAQVRERADGLLAERLLKRDERIELSAHERNADHVIVHVRRGRLIGEDGHIVFEIENRSRAAYRLVSVRVLDGARDVAGPARLSAPGADRDPSGLGVVAAGARVRGLVIVRGVDSVLGKPLVLELAGPNGRGKLRLDHDLVLR